MKLSFYVLLSTFIACVKVKASSEYAIDLDKNHAAAHGIINSILDNRDFGSPVMFSTWESPMGDIYVVPSSTDDDEDDIPALGLGYKLVTYENSADNSFDTLNIAQINEENIVAAGFPFGWFKHSKGDEVVVEEEEVEEEVEEEAEEVVEETEDMEDMEDIEEGQTEQSEEEETAKDVIDEAEYENHDEQDAANAGLFDWISGKDEEDDGDDENNDVYNDDVGDDNTYAHDHFEADHFEFVGVDNADSNQEIVDFEKRDEVTSVRHVTRYTTTTVTSTHGITITKTAEPHVKSNIHTNEKFFPPTTTIEQKNESIIETTTTQPETILSSTLAVSEKTVDPTTTTSWGVPETWNSYPFTKTENVFDPIFSSPPAYTNSSIESTTPYLSSSNGFITSSYYGNKTTIKTSTTFNNSTYTKTKESNNTSILTSSNIGNAPNNYWGSLMGLVFAVCSGVILI